MEAKLDPWRSESEIDAAYFYREDRTFHFSRVYRTDETLQATYVCISYLLKVEHSRNITFNSIHGQVTLFAKKLKKEGGEKKMKKDQIKFVCMKLTAEEYLFKFLLAFVAYKCFPLRYPAGATAWKKRIAKVKYWITADILKFYLSL